MFSHQRLLTVCAQGRGNSLARVPIFNIAPNDSLRWFEVRNDARADAAEILIYDQIGKDWLSDDGISAKQFEEALKAIPENRAIVVRINSAGGNVWDGVAIYNMLRRRKNVTTVVDGLAASIASIIFQAGSKRVMPKNGMQMGHEAQTFAAGNAAEMRAIADKLDTHSDMIAGIYAERSGKKSKDEMRNMMREEFWKNGEECKALGLCDEVSQEVNLSASANFDLSRFRCVPGQLAELVKNSAAARSGATKENIMNREQIIALLKEHGVTVAADITNEALHAELKKALAAKKTESQPTNATDQTAVIKQLQDSLRVITDKLEDERKQREKEQKARITTIVNQCVAESRIDANDAEFWINQACRDEAVLAKLQAMPERYQTIGVPHVAEVTSDSPEKLAEVITNHRKPTAQWIRGEDVPGRALADRAMAIANLVNKYGQKLISIWNTNTIDSDLKRVLILNEVIRAFARKLIAIRQFASVFANVPLQGTDEVVVPYFALDTTASKDWVGANGYVFDQNTSSSKKKITVNKRKYKPMDFGSDEFRRQPYFDVARLMGLKAEQLGVDVFTDILSVVTAANFTEAAVSSTADAFDVDDIADLMGACDLLFWPDVGRSLFIDSLYNVNVCKDPAVRAVLNSGSDAALRNGTTGQLHKFGVVPSASIPLNGAEKIKGFAAFMSAILVATAPVEPAPGVRRQLVSYDLVIEPETGIAFEYRYWGDPQKDGDRQVVECNYGYAAGEVKALKRIVAP